jgi:small subunit ribosomal protein S2
MVDTNCDPNKVDFAIPANDDATKSIAIIVNYVTAAIAEGLAERQAAKEEDVEEGGNDENERKAARIQAEAESETSRGRGEKVKGTSQPKRRVPNSGPRRTGAPR